MGMVSDFNYRNDSWIKYTEEEEFISPLLTSDHTDPLLTPYYTTDTNLIFDYNSVSTNPHGSPLGKTTEIEIRNAKRDLVKLILEEDKMRNCNMEKYIPTKIVVNGPATIVFWPDKTKTIVKLGAGEEFDLYHAFTAALAKKIFRTNSHVKRIIDKNVVLPVGREILYK